MSYDDSSSDNAQIWNPQGNQQGYCDPEMNSSSDDPEFFDDEVNDYPIIWVPQVNVINLNVNNGRNPNIAQQNALRDVQQNNQRFQQEPQRQYIVPTWNKIMFHCMKCNANHQESVTVPYQRDMYHTFETVCDTCYVPGGWEHEAVLQTLHTIEALFPQVKRSSTQ